MSEQHPRETEEEPSRTDWVATAEERWPSANAVGVVGGDVHEPDGRSEAAEKDTEPCP
jgi:hypothetical protein